MNRGASDDDAAVVRASLTDPERFAEIFDRHWPDLHRYCVARLGTGGEDVAAETFRVAFDQRDRYRSDHPSAKPWLFGIATNLIRRAARSRARGDRAGRRLRLATPPADDLETVVVDRALADAAAAPMHQALAELRPEDRELVLLAAWSDLTYREIAEALDLPVGTVRSRLSRSRDRLRSSLGAFR